MKVFLIAGARPNFMKIAPIWKQLEKRGRAFETKIIHTGQHYDYEMSKIFFENLDLPEPHVYFGVGGGSHAEQTARIILEFEKLLGRETPDLVMVVGDVNSTLACALAAAKFRCAHRQSPRPLIAHVEAGLRSRDFLMPEEINRKLTDHLSDLLFTTCADAAVNLKKEGIGPEKVFFVGNVMIDALVQYRDKAKNSKVLARLGLAQNRGRSNYAVLTLHRPENVENALNLDQILSAVREISSQVPVVFPVHPRTRQKIETSKLPPVSREAESSSLILSEPLGYLDFLKLMMEARFVLTDSGGIQEETTVLGVPCLTLRETTERPITVKEGTNIICGVNPGKILKEARAILAGRAKRGKIPKYWDGRAAERIVQVLLSSTRKFML